MSFTSARRSARLAAGALVRAPEAFVLVVVVAVAVGAGSAALGLRPFASVGVSRLLVVLLLATAGRALWGLRDREPGVWDWLVLGPPAVLLMYEVVARLVLPPGARAEWFMGGDHVRHLVFVAEERVAGNLTYSVQPYPRAWHTALTVVWTATGGAKDRAGLASLIDLMSTATWALGAVFCLACGSLTLAVARRAGLGDRVSAVAAAGAATAAMLPPFLPTYQALGFENSLVAAVAVAVAARVLVCRPTAASVALGASCVVVVAHAWQLLLPVVGFCLVLVVARSARARSGALLGWVALLGSAATALPGVWAVISQVGLAHSTDSDVRAPYPLALLVLGLASTGWLVTSSTRTVARTPLRRSWVRTQSWQWPLAAVVVLPGLTALAIATQQHISLDRYYPSKLLWQSTVLSLSPLMVLAAALSVRLRGRRTVPVTVVTGVATTGVVLVGAYALLSPAGAFMGAWSTVDGRRVLTAITTRGAGQAQVVWLGGRGDDTIGRILLDFYRAETTTRTPQEPQDVEGECQILRSSTAPVVLSDHPASSVRARYSCVPDARIVTVRP